MPFIASAIYWGIDIYIYESVLDVCVCVVLFRRGRSDLRLFEKFSRMIFGSENVFLLSLDEDFKYNMPALEIFKNLRQ